MRLVDYQLVGRLVGCLASWLADGLSGCLAGGLYQDVQLELTELWHALCELQSGRGRDFQAFLLVDLVSRGC